MAALVLLTCLSARAQTAHTLGSTVTVGSGFNQPRGVAVDGAGNVYVADAYYNTVNKIPYSGGSYGTPVTLGSGFRSPYGVAVDGAGNVYVADNYNSAIKKIPYSGGVYGTPMTLGSGFNLPDGVAVDGAGNVYVADTLDNAVKEIPYSGGSYGTPVPLGSGFNQPRGVAVDGAGNVYVGDLETNAVEEIPYNGGSYGTPVPLGSGFNHPYGVAVDGAGNVYVAETGNNTVEEIPYSGGSYGTPVPLGSGFNQPVGVAVDGAGNVYVADYGNNAVEKIELAVNFGTVNVGAAAVSQTIGFQIDSAGTLGTPAVLTQGAPGLDFTDAGTGTCTTNGTSHMYAAGDTCTVVVNFSPRFAGSRTGAVELLNSTGNVIATALVSGTGNGPQVAFQSGSTPVTLPSGSGFNQPYGVAVDGAGNVYVADTGHRTVKEIPYSGGSYGSPVTLGSGFGQPYGVAVDGAGNVYVADYLKAAVKQIPYSGGSYGTPVTLGSGFGGPKGVAVDGAGNVFVADTNNGAVKQIPYSGGTYGTPVTLATGFLPPYGVAVDGAGNVYVADVSNGAVKQIPYSGGSYGTPVTLGSGFYAPEGVAVDGAGNVYIADSGNIAVQEIPYSGGSYGALVTLGSGFSHPYGVGVDGAGNVFVADTGNNAVKKIDRADAPTVNFPTATTAGTTDTIDGTQTVTVQNIGNQPLLFAIPASGTNPSSPADFTFNPVGGSACPQLTASASSEGTLAAGASCTLPLTFTPAASSSGGLAESLLLTDNNLNNGNGTPAPTATATQSIGLTGTATPAPTVIASLSPASGPAAGGNLVIITGTNIGGQVPPGGVGYQYFFGTAQASTAGFSSSTSVQVMVPAGIPGSTVPVTVVGPGGTSNAVLYTYQDALSLAKSSLVASPSPAVAGSSITLTATVVDATGNPVSGVSVQFSAGASTTASLSNGGGSITGSNGVATVTLTDTVPETLSLSAFVYGTVSGTLTGSASFVAPAYTVTVLTDETSGNGVATNCVATGLAGDNSNCSLRDAVAAANALTGVTANIGFAPALTASATTANPATIQIAQSTPITMSASMNINGPGANLLTLSGGGNYQIFQQTGGSVTISGLTVANGYSNNGVGSNGGGFYQSAGTLTINNSTFSGNTLNAYASTSCGGAIYAASKLTVSGSTFTGNSISNGYSYVTLQGGAICAASNLTVTDSTFSGNSAANTANYSTVQGGAIYAGSALTVFNSTFSGNAARTSGVLATSATGGAIYAASSVTLTNTIFSGDFATSGGSGVYTPASGGAYASLLNDSAHSDSFTQVSPVAIISGPADLSRLGNYGGPTQTFLPLPGSAAICTGVPVRGVSTDQRGFPSSFPYNGNTCYDIGAVQTAYSLALQQAPRSVTLNSPLTQVAASVSEIGGSIPVGAASVTLTDTDNDLSAAVSGINANGFSPVQVFLRPQFVNAEVSDSLVETLVLNPSLATPLALTATSASFPVLGAPISTANSTLTVNPGSAVAGSTVTVTATLLGAGNFAINGASAAFSSTSTTASFGTPVVNGNVITVSMTDSMAETAPITATFGGNATGVLTGTASFVAPAYVVTVTSDETSGNGVATNCIATGLAGDNSNCSLRDAVAAANALTGVTASIGFSGAAVGTAGNPAVVLIAQSKPITISASMNITGPGANLLTIEGGKTPLSSSNQQVFQQTGGTVTLSGVTVANGYNVVHGGGLYQTGGTLTVSNTTFSGNQASTGNAGGAGGGAIYATTTLTVSNSTFSGNQETAGSGGAIYAGGNSTLTVSNSTFSGNEASSPGAGVNGGAIDAGGNSTLTVSNSTFSGNSANALGGAIYSLSFSTLTVTNSIFSGDTAITGSGVYAPHGGTVTNIVYSGDSFQGVTPTSSISADPKLSALGYNGGPTQTFLPLPGSPAICAGTQPAGATDQRGFPSSFTYNGNTCYDIGAVQTEYALSPSSFNTTQFNVGQPVGVSPVVLTEIGGGVPAGGATVTLTDTQNDLVAPVSASNSAVAAPVLFSFQGVQFTQPEATDAFLSTLILNSTLPTPLSLTSTSSSFQVGQLTPLINFTPNPTSQTYGTPIPAATLEATATSNNVTVSGSFTYTATPQAGGSTVALTAGVTVLPAGQYTLTAHFAPANTAEYAAGMATAGYAVSLANQSTLTVTGPASLTHGTTGTATFTGGSGTGPVTISAGSSTGCAVSGTTVSVTNASGTCSLTATKASDGNYNTVTSAALPVTLVKAAQSTLTVTGPSSLNYGATGALGTSGGSGTGAVTFSAGASTGCSVSGSTVTAGSSGGTCSITATKAADNNYTATTATLPITLLAPAASISLGVSSGTQTYPTWTNFEIAPAIVNGKIPTGTVSLYDNGNLVAKIGLDYGVGYYTANPFNAGINNLTVVYSGDSNYKGGTSAPVTLTVLPAAVNVQASCWGATVWTVAYQCTVNLNSDTSTPPTGAISYSLDGGAPVSVPINGGNAPFTVGTLPAAGSHKLTISYAGEGNYAAARTLTESFTTQPGQTEIQVTPSSYYLATGSSLTVSAVLKTPSSGIPTGTVAFYDGSTLLGMQPIGANGSAGYTVAKIAKGPHNFYAVYAATADYAAATSASTSVTAY